MYTLTVQGTLFQNMQMNKKRTHKNSGEGDLMRPEFGAKVG